MVCHAIKLAKVGLQRCYSRKYSFGPVKIFFLKSFIIEIPHPILKTFSGINIP